MSWTTETQRTRRYLALSMLAVFGCAASGCATVSPQPVKRAPADILASGPTRNDVQRASFDTPDPQKKAAESLKLGDFSPDNISKTTKTLAGYGPNRDKAHKLFAEAETEYKRGAEQTGQARTAAFNSAAVKFAQAAGILARHGPPTRRALLRGRSVFLHRSIHQSERIVRKVGESISQQSPYGCCRPTPVHDRQMVAGRNRQSARAMVDAQPDRPNSTVA